MAWAQRREQDLNAQYPGFYQVMDDSDSHPVFYVTDNASPTHNIIGVGINLGALFDPSSGLISGSVLTPGTGGTQTVTSVSSNALAVGRQGATSPAFNVDSSIAVQVTGLNVQGEASGGGVAVTAIGGTGTETLNLGTSALGAIVVAAGAASSFRTTSANLTLGTLTSGTLLLTSAGAITATSVGVSSWVNSTGAITLQTTTSGAIVLTSIGALTATAAAASSITVTGANLSLITATSGAVVLTSAGAFTFTSASASTWAATGGITISAGTLTISTAATGLAVTNNQTVGGTLNVTGISTLDSGTAPASGASASVTLLLGSVAGFGIYGGTGAPSFSAATGSLYLNYAATTTTTRLYINDSGASTAGTTWTAFTSLA